MAELNTDGPKGWTSAVEKSPKQEMLRNKVNETIVRNIRKPHDSSKKVNDQRRADYIDIVSKGIENPNEDSVKDMDAALDKVIGADRLYTGELIRIGQSHEGRQLKEMTRIPREKPNRHEQRRLKKT